MATLGNRTGSSSSSLRYTFAKVLDNRKHAIRGIWKNGKSVAQITVEDDAWSKAVKWAPLDAETEGLRRAGICQDCKKVKFNNGETPKAARNVRARVWRPRNGRCRSTCNGSDSMIAGNPSLASARQYMLSRRPVPTIGIG